MDQYDAAFEKATQKFADLETARKKAHMIKWQIMENLDKHLLAFEANFTARGGQLIWANNAAEAREAILKIAESQRAKTVVLAKSRTAEEIGLSGFLTEKGIRSVAVGEPAQHAAANAKSPTDTSAEEATLQQMRARVRADYTGAGVCITGASFLIADTGSIVATENDGNIRLGTALPKTHIALVGIEKIIPALTDLDLFLPLLSVHATGQLPATYNSLLTGSRQPYESDGPENMYVVLIDNGRTKLLANGELRPALYSMYWEGRMDQKEVYLDNAVTVEDIIYPGPIGAVVSPYLFDKKGTVQLSAMWPLSGNYSGIYPVDIDINRLLLQARRDRVLSGEASPAEQKGWKRLTYLMLRRRWIDFFGRKIKNMFLRYFSKKSAGNDAQFPEITGKSFSQQWKAQQKHKE